MEGKAEFEEEKVAGDGCLPPIEGTSSWTELSRKEKRKARKKTKRKQERQQLRLQEEERLQDPLEQMKLRLQEAMEAQTLENEKRERDLEEQRWLERERQAQEEAERRMLQEEEDRQMREQQAAAAAEEDEDWEYVEEGPAEIIWKENEIIVQKRKVKVLKRRPDLPDPVDDPNRPTSNPFAPVTPAFADYDQKAAPTSMHDLVEQNPNFGTEQDKTHCPFHIKTGVCRFGARCSRAHVNTLCNLVLSSMANHCNSRLEMQERTFILHLAVSRACIQAMRRIRLHFSEVLVQ